jgi:hypothetical protein
MIILFVVAVIVFCFGLSLTVAAAGADARLARMTERDQHEEEKAL